MGSTKRRLLAAGRSVYQRGPSHDHASAVPRLFTKALADMGVVDFREPMLRLFNQGIILKEPTVIA